MGRDGTRFRVSVHGKEEKITKAETDMKEKF
jgi:hypothetical protein